ncbi:MAG: sigma-70 family RNA polymerase sigma factor [Chloroflexi bacterium]|nr:sigma-70 family RNA polymerase sigma factor [Chloroflexota bacterium]
MEGPSVERTDVRTDAELMSELVDGSDPALAELYDRHGDSVFRIAFRRSGDRQLAEEVMQETFLALWNRAEMFDPSVGSLPGWLGTIARNRTIDRLRALGRRPPALALSSIVGVDPDEDRAVERTLRRATKIGGGQPSPDPDTLLEAAWLRDEVRHALEGMPQSERRVIEMAYYDELSQSEIAAQLGWPLGTVKTRTRRALGRLRSGLAEVLGRDLAPRFAPHVVTEVAPQQHAERGAPGRGRGGHDGPR